MSPIKIRSIFYGLMAAVGLLAVYIVILTIAQDFSHAKEQLAADAQFIFPIIFGFGVQIGLYVYWRGLINDRREKQGSAALAAMSGSVSTVSMVACCAHHLTDVLPILGFSAATIFLAQYRLEFLVLAIASNLLGIIIIGRRIWLVKTSERGEMKK